MAGNVVCNIIAAALDVFSFTLLIPFLNALFGQATADPDDIGWRQPDPADAFGRRVSRSDDPTSDRSAR